MVKAVRNSSNIFAVIFMINRPCGLSLFFVFLIFFHLYARTTSQNAEFEFETSTILCLNTHSHHSFIKCILEKKKKKWQRKNIINKWKCCTENNLGFW